METIIHLKSTNSVTVDQTLQGLIGLFEQAFPDRIRGYYLEGSYANRTALTTSDIDLVILFKGSFIDKAEREKAGQMARDYDAVTEIELDIDFLDEKEISKGVPPSLKIGSRVLFGEPIAESLPLVSVAQWGRERMHAAYWLMVNVFNRPDNVTYPLGYPKPESEFYGYTERKIRLATGREICSTRDLIRVMGWAATALIAQLGSQVVTSKQECHILYRKYINDEWAWFVEALYTQCREEWQYRIPEQASERYKLRHLCQQAVGFENHFLRLYKHFLLSELQNLDMSVKRRALQIQEELPHVDQDIIRLIQEQSTTEDNKAS